MRLQGLLFCPLSFLLLITDGCYDSTRTTVPGTYPVAEIELTKHDGKLFEVWVHVKSGIRLNTLVDSSFFEGLKYGMTLEEAKSRFGPPKSVRMQKDMGHKISLYPVSKGEVGFLPVPVEGGGTNHQVWAFPKNPSPEVIILDPSLRTQLLNCLPVDRSVRVHLLRDVGYSGITLSMCSNRVDYLILGLRDGETL